MKYLKENAMLLFVGSTTIMLFIIILIDQLKNYFGD